MTEITVAAWGSVSSPAELWNTVHLANSVQKRFKFTEYEGKARLPINEDRYRVEGGGLNLDAAAQDLLRTRTYAKLAASHLLLITSLPYSNDEPNLSEEDPLKRDLFFTSSDWVPGTKAQIASTYIWERLPTTDHFPERRDGRRPLQPYLLYCLATAAFEVATEKFSIPVHDSEVRACLNDYCNDPYDIDQLFIRGRGLCDDCEKSLFSAQKSGLLHNECARAVRRLIYAMLGKHAKQLYDRCFLSYGTPDTVFATKLHDHLQARGVNCYMYDLDSVPGADLWKEIIAERRARDRLLLVCSKVALIRDGLLREIEQQIDDDPAKLLLVSIDKDWRSPDFKIARGTNDLKPRLLERNYVDFENLNFEQALTRLIAALKWNLTPYLTP